jgi:hypothetical protein
VAVPADRACHPAEVAAAVVAEVAAAVVAEAAAAVAAEAAAAVAAEAGGRYENIQHINSRTFKGEEDDASRKPQ